MDPCAHDLLACLSLSEVENDILLLLLLKRVPVVEICVPLVVPVFAIIPQIFPSQGRPWESGRWGCTEPRDGRIQPHTIPNNCLPSSLFDAPFPPPSTETPFSLRVMHSRRFCCSSLWYGVHHSPWPTRHVCSSPNPNCGHGFVLFQMSYRLRDLA